MQENYFTVLSMKFSNQEASKCTLYKGASDNSY